MNFYKTFSVTMEWNLNITYGRKPYSLKATVEYHSTQIMRIRVNGKTRSLLLENNYPLLQAAKTKKSMQWKIREGFLDDDNPSSNRLMLEIMEQLEYCIKAEFPM